MVKPREKKNILSKESKLRSPEDKARPRNRKKRKSLSNGKLSKTGLGNGIKDKPDLTKGNLTKKGLVEGRGLTNGNGLVNGRNATRGLTKGNGLTNGNGLVNGRGLTNGNGLINGRGNGGPSFHSRKKSNRSALIAGTAIVIVILLLSGALFIFGSKGTKDRIIIDGNFGDWKGAPMLADPSGDASRTSVDITNYGLLTDQGRIFLYTSVLGKLFEGEPQGGSGRADELDILLDLDHSATTGYHIGGIGADILVQVYGRGGTVAGSSFSRYNSALGDGNRWNCWDPAGTPTLAKSKDSVELTIGQGAGPDVRPDALFIMRGYDGSQDTSNNILDNTGAAVTVLQTGPSVSVLPKSSSQVPLSVDLTALGHDMILKGLNVTVRGSATPSLIMMGMASASVVNGKASFATSELLKKGSVTTFKFTADTTNLPEGSSLGLSISARSDVFLDYGTVTFSGQSKATTSYVGSAPKSITIDGAFGDWSNIISDKTADTNNSNVDLKGFSVNISGDALSFYLDVNGKMMAGTDVPAGPLAVSSAPPAQVDTDRDGVPDSVDPLPKDFNNDNITDAASNYDIDGDGVKDYPHGTDDFLTTRIPSGFPAPYRGKDVSIYLGPAPELPPVSGVDSAYILIDTDSLESTGMDVGGLGADYLVNITGRNGQILTSVVEKHTGSPGDWSWSPVGTVSAATDFSQLETSVSLTTLGVNGPVKVLMKTTDWSTQHDWSDRVLGVQKNTLGNTSAVAGALFDPFAIFGDSSVYQSTDAGATWSHQGDAGTGKTYTDITVGDKTTGGYIYILRNDGQVYFTDRAVNGWTQYGYGTPTLPVNDAYLGITAGIGPASGYLFLLRSDGSVFFTDRGTTGWNQYGYNPPAVPTSLAYVDIICNDLTGYIYVLRNDGNVYFTDRGVSGWNQYGYGAGPIPTSTAYISLAAGSGSSSGNLYVLRDDGKVYFTDRGVSGWTQYGYGSSNIPTGDSYVSIAAGTGATSGYVYVLRNDGTVYMTDRAVNGWTQYGYGTSAIPTSTAYRSLIMGLDGTNGYTYVLRNDGKVYMTDRAVNGWTQYGYGTSQPPVNSAWVAITASTANIYSLKGDGSVSKSTNSGVTWSDFGDAGSDTSWVSIAVTRNYVYALRNDGTVQRSPLDSYTWTTSGGDTGTGTSWVSIATDDANRLYAMQKDGTVVTADESSWTSAWSDKGDAGSGTSWVSLTAFSSTGKVYALRNDRVVESSDAGTSTSWSAYASAGTDTAWTSIAADATYVYVMRNDGNIDRAKISDSSWTSTVGDVGTGYLYTGLTVLQIPEFNHILIPMLGMIAIFLFWRAPALRGRAKTNLFKGA